MSWTEDIPAALQFALIAHGDQKYGHRPYWFHPAHVVLVLLHFGFDPSLNDRNRRLVMAGYLHDVLEDTVATTEELSDAFGQEVADLVEAVTNEPGKNRRERHSKTYCKTLAVPDAVILKLADRIANVESCLGESKPLFRMYLKEHGGFRDTLYRKGEVDEMWLHLERMLGWEEGESP